MEQGYIVAASGGGNKIWELADTLEAAFVLGSQWRAAGLTSVTVASVIDYTATIHIVAGEDTFDLDIPAVPA